MLVYPLGVLEVIGVTREVPFLGPGPQQVVAVEAEQEQAMAQ